jgi:hypothetical protein
MAGRRGRGAASCDGGGRAGGGAAVAGCRCLLPLLPRRRARISDQPDHIVLANQHTHATRKPHITTNSCDIITRARQFSPPAPVVSRLSLFANAATPRSTFSSSSSPVRARVPAPFPRRDRQAAPARAKRENNEKHLPSKCSAINTTRTSRPGPPRGGCSRSSTRWRPSSRDRAPSASP